MAVSSNPDAVLSERFQSYDIEVGSSLGQVMSKIFVFIDNSGQNIWQKLNILRKIEQKQKKSVLEGRMDTILFLHQVLRFF